MPGPPFDIWNVTRQIDSDIGKVKPLVLGFEGTRSLNRDMQGRLSSRRSKPGDSNPRNPPGLETLAVVRNEGLREGYESAIRECGRGYGAPSVKLLDFTLTHTVAEDSARQNKG
jgi:hypothetical protein